MDQTGIASSLFVLSARKKKQRLRVRSCLGLAAAGGSSSALCSSVLVPGSRRLPLPLPLPAQQRARSPPGAGRQRWPGPCSAARLAFTPG